MYGMQGFQGLRNGILGDPLKLKARGKKWPVLASTTINVNVGVSTTQNYTLPFSVSDPRLLDIDWQAAASSSAGGFIPVSLLIPRKNGSGRIHVINNNADTSRDYDITYSPSTNQITVTTGAISGASGVLQVRLRQRIIRAEAAITDPGVTTESSLPFTISNIENVYVGGNGSYASVFKLLTGYLPAGSLQSWHVTALNTSLQALSFKITSPTTFMRGVNAFSSLYLIEFES